MQSVKASFESLTEVKRSKFLTLLIPFNEFEGLQERLKREHPKANHVVYAVRYLNEYDQIVENSSDDGEPKGCAGVPALNVLRGEEMINCAVLIVRYFGGIKLGTGGMARAYAQAVKDVLKKAEISPYEKKISYHFKTSYTEVNRVLYLLKQLEIVCFERAFDIEMVVWKIQANRKQIEKLSPYYKSIT